MNATNADGGVQIDDDGDAAIFTQTNIAIWVLTSASGAFLAVRLWCRHRFSKLWWDDALLTFSWVCQTLDIYDKSSRLT
jgi:hypothetical protein